MKSKLLLIALLFSLSGAGQYSAFPPDETNPIYPVASFTIPPTNVAKTLTAFTGINIAFYEYIPANPKGVIIQFHGNGECGDGTVATLTKLDNIAISGQINKGTFTQPFIVLSPQLKTAYCTEWRLWYVWEMVWYAQKFGLPIYLTGYSLGGGAVWTALNDSATCSMISGAVPVCGTSTFTTAKWVNQYKVPVWAYHGEKDATIGVGNTYAFTSVITGAKKTIYKGLGHGIWDIVYNQIRQDYVTTNEWNQVGSTKNDPTPYEWFASLPAATVPPVIVPPPPTRTIVARLFVNGWEIIVYSDKTTEIK